MPDATPVDREPQQMHAGGDATKALPVVFIIGNMIGLYGIYVVFHCLPMILDKNESTRHMGWLEFWIFNALTVLLVVSYVRCVVTHPGTIPEASEDPSWSYSQQPGDVPTEKKKDGKQRHCKWCRKWKPDRCHHCRVCQMCILKMDHHCPWLNNCVGFRNQKYFFLFVFYSSLATQMMAWTMFPTVQASVDTETPFSTMFVLLFGETLAAFLGLLVTVFFIFHVWLMFKAMTTIEFCESKAVRRPIEEGNRYDRGVYGNVCAVLGDNMLLWLLPCSPSPGNGLTYKYEDTPLLNRDLETGRGIRPKSVWRTQNSKARAKRRSAGTGAPPGDSEVDSSNLGSDHNMQDYKSIHYNVDKLSAFDQLAAFTSCKAGAQYVQ